MSQTSKIILAVVITAVIVGGFVYWWQSASTTQEPLTEITTEQSEIEADPTQFSFPKESISIHQQSENQSSLKLVKTDNKWAYYEGNITLSGVYSYHPEGMLGGKLCFTPDAKTEPLLPGATKFCFENTDEARQLIGIDAEVYYKPAEPNSACPVIGNAEIVISDFKDEVPGGVLWGTSAILKEVLNKEPYQRDCLFMF